MLLNMLNDLAEAMKASDGKKGGADRLDTYCTGGTCVLDAFPAQAVVDRRDHPCGYKNSDKLNVPDDLQVLRLNFRSDASHLTIYDSRVRFGAIKRCCDF